METVKLGVAGVGHFGRYHALKAAASPRTQLVGVYDLDPERARTVGWEAGAPSPWRPRPRRITSWR
jgi:predicted dehydrogenase